MASTKIPVELSSTPGIVDNSNATAITIDSSGNVLIGTDSGDSFNSNSALRLQKSNHNYLQIKTPTNKQGGVLIGDTGDDFVGGFIYSNSDNQLWIYSGNDRAIVCDSSQNVGIGTTSPTDKVQVLDSGSLALRVESTGTTNQSSVWTENNAGSINGMFMYGSSHSGYGAIAAGEGAFYSNTNVNIMSDSSTGNIKFSTGSSGGSERMRINSSGNVGIGETSIDANLHITHSNPNLKFEINGQGKWAIGMPAGQTYLAFDESNDALTTPTMVMTKTTKRVGIGTTSPGHALDVVGTGQPAIEATCTAGHFAIEASTPYDYVAKFSSTDSGAAIVLQDNSSTNHANRINVSGNTMQFVTGATTAVTINASQNVGIGVTTPTHQLHIKGPSSAYAAMRIESTSTGHGAIINLGDGTDDDYGQIVQFASSAGEGGRMRFIAGGTETLNLRGGKVGIGTSNPTHKLVVSENSSGLAANFLNSNTSGAGVNIAAASGDSNYAFRVEDYAGNEKVRINGSGKVGIGTSTPGHKVHVYGGSAHTNLVVSTADGYKAEVRMMEDAAGTQHGGFIRYDGNGDYVRLGTYNGGTESINLSLKDDGNVGIGVTNPGYKLAVSSKLVVGDSPAVGLSGNTIHVRENSNSGIHFPIVIGGGTHSAGAAFGIGLDPEGYGNRNKIAILAEGIGAGYSRGRLHFALDNANDSGQVTLADSKMCITESGNIGIGAQVDNPSGTLDIRSGRAGIISTDSSWGQFRVANSTVNEVGVTVMNGCTASEYLSDGAPTSSNKFIMGISPYGSGTDTWGIGHGNLGDSIMHIDGSGNFGFGPNTDNPLTYFEISKTRPNVNAPADYELKMTLNTYGYVGSNYKLGMIQFVGGDTASAQDNFYAGISARAVNGANHQEDGALQFHVRSDQDTETLAVELNGEHNPSSQIAGSGSVRNGMLFKWQGIAIDRSWGNYPGIAVMNSSDYSTTASTQAEFRVHGTNGSVDSYPGSSGSDFSVNFRVDGSYLTGSDKRRKKNITTIDNALSTVKQLTGKKFQVINRADEVQETTSKNGYKFGLIAQDVEDIIPEATKYYKDEDDGTEGWNSSYSIDYPSLTALLINAIKEQDATIKALEARIKALEDK